MLIYLDTQIFTYLKSSDLKYKEFQDCLESLIGSSVIPYSGAHLDDLSKNITKPELTIEDLVFMEPICNNVYFHVDPYHVFHINIERPLDAYNSQYYGAINAALNNPNTILSLVEDLSATPELKPLGDILHTFLQTPIGPFITDEVYDQLDERAREKFDSLLNGLKGVKTIEDFVKTAMFESGILFNDADKFKEFKKYTHEKIDKAKFGYNALGMEFDEKLRASPVAHTFKELLIRVIPESQQKDLFHIFNLAYLFLEILNISPDTTRKGKAKHSSFSNLTIDGNHAFFSSYCDIFITDDFGLQVKATIIFNLLGISCKILGSLDFVDYYYKYLNSSLTLLGFEGLILSIEKDEMNQVLTDESNGIMFKRFKLDTILFGYFDTAEYRIDDKLITFYKNRISNSSYVVTYREIKILIATLQAVLGIDVDQLGEFIVDELNEVRNYLRKYTKDNYSVYLDLEETNEGSFIFLEVYL